MKEIKLHKVEEMYVLDTTLLKSIKDIVAVLKGMKLSIPFEIYHEGIPLEAKKYFKKTSINDIF